MSRELDGVTSVVLFTLKTGTAESDWYEALRSLGEMWESIPEVKGWSIGKSKLTEERGGGFEYAVVLRFDDEADWRVYMDHPVHKETAGRFLVPLYDRRGAAVLVRGFDGKDEV